MSKNETVNRIFESERKLRVWWIPQIGIEKSFYIQVNNPIEARKIMDVLGAYDKFQLELNLKGDYCNIGGLQMYDEEECEWIDWFIETEDDYYEDLDEYLDSLELEEIEEFSNEMYSQVSWED